MEEGNKKQVQALTPYLSARRGGSGDVWLNANESPFDNEYSLNLTRLNRYGSVSPELIDAYAQYAGVAPTARWLLAVLTRYRTFDSRVLWAKWRRDSLLPTNTYGYGHAISAETIGGGRKSCRWRHNGN